MKRLKPAIFLDRDGTILNERGYLGDPRKIHFYSFAFGALRRLSKAGYKLVVITNQSGVARGYFSLAQLAKVHRRFQQMLRAKGVRLAGIYFCPHAPTAGCVCRKPKPFLVKRAAREHALDVKNSFVIGDQERDLMLAKNAGARGILVLTGAGKRLHQKERHKAVRVARDLKSATDWILKG